MSDTPNTLYQLFQLYHRQLGFGVIAAILAVLRHIHNGERVGVYAFDAAVCMFLAAGADQLLEIFGLPSKWGYFAAIFIGVFGWKVIVGLVKSRVEGASNEVNPRNPR